MKHSQILHNFYKIVEDGYIVETCMFENFVVVLATCCYKMKGQNSMYSLMVRNLNHIVEIIDNFEEVLPVNKLMKNLKFI
jgi:hypothetical protein